MIMTVLVLLIRSFFVMGRNIANARLTKNFILSKISQVSIFHAYTQIPIDDINRCIENGTLISSPFRIDNHPSFGFRYNNKGKLKAKDFAGYFHGDCFDAAALTISYLENRNLDINDKRDFYYVLQHIAYKFANIIYGKEEDNNFDDKIEIAIDKIKHSKTIIEFIPRTWDKIDINYWKTFGISISYLNTNFIYPIDALYINRGINPEPKYKFNTNPSDRAYAYMLGIDSRGVHNIKVYFPNRDKGEIRFITNANCLEGIFGIQNEIFDVILITKSTKDRIAVQEFIKTNFQATSPYGALSFDIGFINLPNEIYKLRQIEYDYIRNKTKTGIIVSLMDNDIVGKREALWLKEHYNIIPLLIPKQYNAKDFSDLYKNNDVDDVAELVYDAIEYINEKIYEQENKYTWDKEESDTLPY